MSKFTFVFLLLPFLAIAQNDAQTCEILSKINTLIEKYHIQPKPIDDSLSVFVFDNLIDNLDDGRTIFLKSEYDQLSKKYRLQIDNFIAKKNCYFLTDIQKIYTANLLRNQAVLEKIKLSEIDYSIIDSIRFYKKNFPVYLQKEEVQKVLTKKLRYDILEDIASSSTNKDSLNLNFKTLEHEAKNRIIDNELCRISAVLENKNNLQELLYNIFCTYFDPHTAYFSNDSKSNFVASLSKEHLSLGMNVSLNKQNEIIIQNIDTNGPVFKTGLIKKGDQIISISNLKDTLQVSCAALESISNMILSDSNKKIILTLKRNSGKSFDVLVEKQLIKDEENSVYSFVIKQHSKKYGYLKIPSFYGDLEGNNGKGCAEDTALEILKLQKEKIKGLVIDLTDNGGGSMEEAIKLAGMFVDSGPISIVVDNSKKQEVIYDPYKGMIFKDPIVVLINGNSASASEFFSSILQDYNRAFLVGYPSLGKATMQSILPLDNDDTENYAKVTINKFYRITGKSHQGIGVIPNIKMPTVYETINAKESDSPTALKNDSIASQLRYRVYMTDDSVSKIVNTSTNRIAATPFYNDVIQMNIKIDELLENPKAIVPITLDALFEQQTVLTQLWKEISILENQPNDLTISNSKINNFLLTLNPSENENNLSQIANLEKNHYLLEAISILEDVNTLKSN